MTMPRSLQAAVKRLELNRDLSTMQTPLSTSSDDWQAEAWRLYEQVGELQSVCSWLGNAASRVTLFAAEVDAETGRADTPTTDKAAQSIVSDMAGGVVGQSSMNRQAAVLLTVVGEYYVAIMTDDDGAESWNVVPHERVSRDMNGNFTVNINGHDRSINAETDSLFRVHVPDPRKPERAHSSVKAALPILREIVAMDSVIRAESQSRVAGAGLLIVPTEAQLPTTNAPGAAGAVNSASFSRRLAETMRKATDDLSSPEAITPVVVRVPGEMADKFKHLTLSSDITKQAVETREKAIRRLALSLDIPPEVLTGLGDSTHWNANLVDESALRQHIAPLMAVICEAMTEAVLRPLLEHEPLSIIDPDDVFVAFSMQALAQKQDRSQTAIEAFDRNAITAGALRRELGFSEDDAPAQLDDIEQQQALAERLVSGAPSLLPLLADILGLDINVNASQLPGGDHDERL